MDRLWVRVTDMRFFFEKTILTDVLKEKNRNHHDPMMVKVAEAFSRFPLDVIFPGLQRDSFWF
jgi:hypothetical protein